MTDTAATFDDVISFDGRIFSLGFCRRAVRFLLGGVAVGLGSAAAVAALIAAVTMTAVWIVNSAFVTHPDFQAKTPTGPAALTLAHVLGHAEVAHPFATELSASWLTHHPRHSQDPRRFTKEARLLAALRERDELPAASVGGKA